MGVTVGEPWGIREGSLRVNRGGTVENRGGIVRESFGKHWGDGGTVGEARENSVKSDENCWGSVGVTVGESCGEPWGNRGDAAGIAWGYSGGSVGIAGEQWGEPWGSRGESWRNHGGAVVVSRVNRVGTVGEPCEHRG